MWLSIIIILGVILMLPYATILMFYRKWFLQMIPFVTPANIEPSTTFSIIIPARNEAMYIGNCLQSIIQQQYAAHLFEVIVIDDHSTDNTKSIVEQFSKQYSNIKLISLADIIDEQILNSYKKKAIEYAIGFAKGEWIITTDADCKAPINWLKNFDAWIQFKKPVLIAAPVLYHNNGSILQTFQMLDFMMMQGVTIASVHKGFHNMCNGANLTYKKSVFFEVNGFKGIDDIASGDDMLLMNKIKEAYPNDISILFSDESIVITHPMPTWKSFLNQRMRWASKAEKFKSKDQKIFAVLVLVYCLNVLLFVMPFFALAYHMYVYYWMLLVCFKTLTELAFALPVAHFFKQKFVWWFPLLQPIHIAYIVVSGWLGKFGNYQWKDRRVH